jgi:hypothetical protein
MRPSIPFARYCGAPTGFAGEVEIWPATGFTTTICQQDAGEVRIWPVRSPLFYSRSPELGSATRRQPEFGRRRPELGS